MGNKMQCDNKRFCVSEKDGENDVTSFDRIATEQEHKYGIPSDRVSSTHSSDGNEDGRRDNGSSRDLNEHSHEPFSAGSQVYPLRERNVNPDAFRIVVMGSHAVGKTSLIYHIMNIYSSDRGAAQESRSESRRPSQDSVRRRLSIKEQLPPTPSTSSAAPVQYRSRVIDYPNGDYNSLRLAFFEVSGETDNELKSASVISTNASAFLLCYDCIDPRSLEVLHQYVKLLTPAQRKRTLLLGLKKDLAGSERIIRGSKVLKFQEDYVLPWSLEMSALNADPTILAPTFKLLRDAYQKYISAPRVHIEEERNSSQLPEQRSLSKTFSEASMTDEWNEEDVGQSISPPVSRSGSSSAPVASVLVNRTMPTIGSRNSLNALPCTT